MDVGPPFVAHAQTAEVIEPGERALHHPAMPTQALAGIGALARDADPDMAAGECPPAARIVVALVGMDLVRALAATAVRLPNGWDGIEQPLEDDRIVAIGAGQEGGEREPGPLDHKVVLRPRFAAIRRVGAGLLAPLLARTLILSKLARLQSMAA